jgi:hypothetical protein
MSVSISIVPEDGRTAKEEVALDISAFEQWFMSFLKNGDPLTRHERAIINDYVGWKAGQVKTQG